MSLEPSGRSGLELDVVHGYLSRGVQAPRRGHPQIIVNDGSVSMLRALRQELKRSTSFTFSVAFVSPRAIALLKQELVEFAGRGRIVTSDYLGFNSPRAFGELLNLSRLGIDVRLHDESAFHPKGYVFEHEDRLTAFVGSSNLTESALVLNHEWNLRVSASPDSDLRQQFAALIDSQVADSQPLSAEWIDSYRERYVPPAGPTPARVERATRSRLHSEGPQLDDSPQGDQVTPNAMQQEALLAIESMRGVGKRKAVVISATGTGKTILSALDVRAASPERMLFIVHREQILDRAIQEFKRVLGEPDTSFGKLSGSTKQAGRRYVFATVQTLSRPEVLESLRPDAFDYVLVDEVHRAGAESYRRVLDHFAPKFLLGMTATPERTDGFNVFELFDFNVPYEIRLNKALESEMLTPFHYYGVTDVEFDDGSTVGEGDDLTKLSSAIRVEHIVQAITTYGHAGTPVRGLMFCSRKDEAQALSDALNQRFVYGHRLRTIALTGDDSIEHREQVVQQLERGEIDYILTVDIFNEGVDIPAVNQVVMLRQTQSAIVFVQQLGRGLRKSPGKDYLVVIDFIGNYANNYLIPIALFGDESLNRESIRQHLISAEEVGVISGMSAIRFDRIAQERVLRSISQSQLDSWQHLRSALDTLRSRLGHIPRLWDFLRFDAADPVVLATKAGNYPALVARLTGQELALTDSESRFLTLLSAEALSAKRKNELLLLQALLLHGPRSLDELAETFGAAGLHTPLAAVESAARTLSLDFHTEAERRKYQHPIVIRLSQDQFTLASEFEAAYNSSSVFRDAVDDVVQTGLSLVERRYDIASPFTPAKLYSRKDACRLLRWRKNVTSTIYGYRVDHETETCPIFVTLHKSDGIAASTAYEDELQSPSTMVWFTRSRRTLQSREVAAIVSADVKVHVFAKKDDADGTDFYYLGEAKADQAEETSMSDDHGNQLSVVRMLLRFAQPIDAAIFDYFRPNLTEGGSC